MSHSVGKYILIFVSSILLASPASDELRKRTEDWNKVHPDSPPHWMTPEEEQRKDEIGRDFYPTDPPIEPVRNIAEFEPMEGVLIRYPFGIPYDIIAEMAEDIVVTTVVTGASQENYVRTQYENNGVNINHCNFLYAPSESYWSRDYGPWFITDGNNDVAIVNFVYNRPRPNDNDIPIEVAEFLDVPLYGMQLTHAGGNYMTDGKGISASSDLVWVENSLSESEIDQMVYDYLGVETYHVVPDPNNTYIDHIDCWGKFLDVDKILFREVPTSHAQYDEIEETAAYFASQVSSYGTPYEIYRVYTPQDQPYTNSLILNDKVLVPITGSSWDDDAILAYQNAMPGYEILGFDGDWYSTDALHCRTKGIADTGMLYISHIPVSGEIEADLSGILIEAEIHPYSGTELIDGSVQVYYRTGSFGLFQSVQMTNTTGDHHQAVIPVPIEENTISYYIYAEDQSGRTASHPFIGEPDPHQFMTIVSNITITVEHYQGWNMVGVPVDMDDYHYLSVYPTAIENSFFNSDSMGYVSDTLFIRGEGAWLRFEEEGSTAITGYPIEEISLEMYNGWNLITGISTSISANDIEDPDGIIIDGTIYSFNGMSEGYVSADSLFPGKGYWLRTRNSGWITLVCRNN